MNAHNSFIYALHELQNQGLKAYFGLLSLTLSYQQMLLRTASTYGLTPNMYTSEAHKLIAATQEISSRMIKDYHNPGFNLDKTRIGAKDVTVRESVVEDRPFGALLHFERDTARKDPKVLIVAPMSGHHATLLRDTVDRLLPAHDVYITDWKDAKNVPYDDGDFGFDDYVSYVKDFIKKIGPGVHVIAVCQPTVPVLAAAARLADEKSPVQPLSVTLMGGPVDVRTAESSPVKFAQSKSVGWFAKNMIGRVPNKYAGGGRLVYPGFIQLASFVSMNPQKHARSHHDLFRHSYEGNAEKADKIKNFYDDYFAVCDLPGKFYLDTIEKVFINVELPQGRMTHEGKKVDLGAITKTAILSIEGENDDISPPGHTTAVHAHTRGLKPDQKYNYMQEGAGHYGIFSGRLWREQISSRVTGFIRAAAEAQGVRYDKLPENMPSVLPERWQEEKTAAARKAAPQP